MEVNSKKGTVRRVIICDKSEVISDGTLTVVTTETACILRHLRKRISENRGEEKAESFMRKLSEIATMSEEDFENEIECLFKELREDSFSVLMAEIFMRRDRKE